jgi:hypothetical protein
MLQLWVWFLTLPLQTSHMWVSVLFINCVISILASRKSRKFAMMNILLCWCHENYWNKQNNTSHCQVLFSNHSNFAEMPFPRIESLINKISGQKRAGRCRHFSSEEISESRSQKLGRNFGFGGKSHQRIKSGPRLPCPQRLVLSCSSLNIKLGVWLKGLTSNFLLN